MSLAHEPTAAMGLPGGLWSPGVRLFSRLRFVGKAAVICTVFLLVLAPLAFLSIRASGVELHKSERELAGLAVAREVLPMFHRVQQLRGQWHAAAGQRTAPVDAGVKELETRLAALEQRIAAGPLELAEPLKFARQAFTPLQAAAADGEEAFNRADGFSQQLQRLMVEVADVSGLSMDPDPAAFQLAHAGTHETLQLAGMVARVRDLGSHAIEQKSLGSFARRIVQGDTYVLYTEVEQVFATYDRLARGNEALAQAVAFQQGLDPVNTFLRGVRKSVLPETGPRGDAAAFAAAGDAAGQALQQLSERSFAEVERLVSQRVAALQTRRGVEGGAIAVALGVAGYLFCCFYLVTRHGMQEVTRHVQALAAGDLSTTPRAWGRDETAELLDAVHEMQVSLRALVGEVRTCADDIVMASGEVAAGAEDLSQRTETAASRLQQTASTMDTIAESVGDTAKRVHESADLGQSTAASAARSQQAIGAVVETMAGIEASARRVADILGVIDGIAFQTNILALNAAVEAARAGEHGRGFAVVAGEVRSLAQRSAGAAREIKTLIVESGTRTEQGTRTVHTAGEAMSALLRDIARISEMLGGVRGATEQQRAGVGEVSQAVAQLDQDTQRNAALVEQTSAAALSMKSKAERLAHTAARFRLPAQA